MLLESWATSQSYMESSHKVDTFLSTHAPIDGDHRIQDWILQKGNLVIPMDKITTQCIWRCNLPQGFKYMQIHCGTYTKHNASGKIVLRAYGALVFHLSNGYFYGDAYWVCSRLSRIFKRYR